MTFDADASAQARQTVSDSAAPVKKKVTEKVDLTTVSVETFHEYELRTLVDNFSKSWSSKSGKALADKLTTRKGLYIWMRKSIIPALVEPLEWFGANLLETDPKRGSLIRAHYIGSGDILGRGWSSPVGKHPFGDWLKGEDNVEDLNKTDFQLFYLSIEDQAIYEGLETALQEWNKVNREDKLSFEISETSASGGSHGSRLRNVNKQLMMMEVDELMSAQKTLLVRQSQLWIDVAATQNMQNLLARNS